MHVCNCTYAHTYEICKPYNCALLLTLRVCCTAAQSVNLSVFSMCGMTVQVKACKRESPHMSFAVVPYIHCFFFAQSVWSRRTTTNVRLSTNMLMPTVEYKKGNEDNQTDKHIFIHIMFTNYNKIHERRLSNYNEWFHSLIKDRTSDRLSARLFATRPRPFH